MSPSPAFDCDVLVIGAGPAGSACAQALARAGLRVTLADQHAFPRDKVCGDGLIPDAHAAFDRLGVRERVAARAKTLSHLRCVGPRGGSVDVPGRLAVMPRRELDEILREAAVAAGARWWPHAKMVALLSDGVKARVSGARFTLADGTSREFRAHWVVLATGAVPQALIAGGLCERRTPSGVALRGYVRNAALAREWSTMDVVWHRDLGRGYGWLFPGPDGVFNVGVGLAHSHSHGASGESMTDVNLRDVFERFSRVYAPARRLLDGGEWLAPLKGAPLRCSLEGAPLAQPGVLVTGEAAGSTYAFTGEGIGKAMETGLLAAQAIVDEGDFAAVHRDGQIAGASDARVRERYARDVGALKPRFDLYERANKVNEQPWMIDLLLWRARRSPRVLRRMAAVLEEEGNPGNLVSVRGVVRLFNPLP